MQPKDYTHPLSLNPNNLADKHLLGEIRLTNKQGIVIIKARFKSKAQRRHIADAYRKLHLNKLNSGEWYLSYLLD